MTVGRGLAPADIVGRGLAPADIVGATCGRPPNSIHKKATVLRRPLLLILNYFSFLFATAL